MIPLEIITEEHIGSEIKFEIQDFQTCLKEKKSKNEINLTLSNQDSDQI